MHNLESLIAGNSLAAIVEQPASAYEKAQIKVE